MKNQKASASEGKRSPVVPGGALHGKTEPIRKLEDELNKKDKAVSDKSEVIPYINEILSVNPHLNPFEKELKKASDIYEARELIEKYNSMSGKIRLDRINKDVIDEENNQEVVNEGTSYLKNRNWI